MRMPRAKRLIHVLVVAALCAGGTARAAEDTTAPASSFDSGPPITTTGPLPAGFVTGTATDDSSGVASVTVTFTPLAPGGIHSADADLSCDTDGLRCAFRTNVPAAPGVYAVSAEAIDRAHNIESPGPSMTVLVL